MIRKIFLTEHVFPRTSHRRRNSTPQNVIHFKVADDRRKEYREPEMVAFDRRRSSWSEIHTAGSFKKTPKQRTVGRNVQISYDECGKISGRFSHCFGHVPKLGALHARVVAALPALAQAQIVGSGGALLHSPVLQCVLADVLGLPLALSAIDEASARGTAILALQALGALPKNHAPMPPTSVIAPNSANRAIYQAAAQRQERLYAALLGGG